MSAVWCRFAALLLSLVTVCVGASECVCMSICKCLCPFVCVYVPLEGDVYVSKFDMYQDFVCREVTKADRGERHFLLKTSSQDDGNACM